MTPQEELNYIIDVLDEQIRDYEFNLNLLEEEKQAIQIIEDRTPICYNITFVEGNLNALRELKVIIDEQSYREVLHSDEHEANEV